ncbi:MT-A70 family methyltransferase [Maritalea porphyrae]|uniref:MT-A70 family methyltransferase n=1 Tax=Maritalea porphyrae TaxID=880732 RepID=UPI0022B043AA|nr:MT-A70 family methyltransferase [Maritalea porphyrae]MCZ4274018.1 MT-A70 family methyltransferase [Maritalea porphyrae]
MKNLTNYTALKPHPYADMFPYMATQWFADFVDDIRQNGLQEQIILLEGKILDGRNRYKALQEIGEFGPKHFIDFAMYCKLANISPDPLQFVLSKNLQRRHLSSSQRATVAAKIADMSVGAQPKSNTANLQNSAPKTSIKDAAAKLQVSERSVAHAKTVIAHGAPELASAVEQGALKVSAAAALAKLPAAEQAEIMRDANPKAIAKVTKELRDKKTAEKKQKRAEKEQALGAKQIALPDKKYGVILADPEWKFEPYSQETGMDRAADNHYPTSAIEEIMARPVGEIAAKDCLLIMWATRANFPNALRVVEAWGFKFCTFGVWHKLHAGNGYWLRDNGEPFIIATRGKVPAPAMGTQPDAVFRAPKGKHSQKPSEIHEFIEKHYPSLPKIELNARTCRPGWDVWGNEAPEAEETPAAVENLPVVAAKSNKLAEQMALLNNGARIEDGMFRDVPEGQPTVKDLLAFGDLVHLVAKGEIEEYRVLNVGGPYESPAGQYYTVSLKEPAKFNPKPKGRQQGDEMVREMVAVGGKILPLDLEKDLEIIKQGEVA